MYFLELNIYKLFKRDYSLLSNLDLHLVINNYSVCLYRASDYSTQYNPRWHHFLENTFQYPLGVKWTHTILNMFLSIIVQMKTTNAQYLHGRYNI